jgi:Xaa-Pro aminopeptidase
VAETPSGSKPEGVAAATRPERLSEAVASSAFDALLVTRPINIEYLTGFTGTNAACLTGPDIRVFLTDFRYADRAATEVAGWDVEIVDGEWLAGVARCVSEYVPGGTAGIEEDHLTMRTGKLLTKQLTGGLSLADSGGMVERLRRSKDAVEVAAIAAAAELTDSIYSELFERGLVGRTEADVAGYAVGRMREHGAEPSFTPIVAAGPNGASPHAEPGPREIREGELVVIDMGSRLDGYCSDCTRTVATGEIEDEASRIYEVTLRANQSALEAVAAGRSAAEIDGVARDLITRAGYGEQFGHGLGHGVGMEIHEAPRLGPRSDDTLIAGDVVTVEPGIYLSGRYGVRIEDLVVVSADGISRNLSSHPKDLIKVD